MLKYDPYILNDIKINISKPCLGSDNLILKEVPVKVND